VLTELKSRGVEDVLIVVCDGLTGLPAAIEAVWPAAKVQACIVYADVRIMPNGRPTLLTGSASTGMSCGFYIPVGSEERRNPGAPTGARRLRFSVRQFVVYAAVLMPRSPNRACMPMRMRS